MKTPELLSPKKSPNKRRSSPIKSIIKKEKELKIKEDEEEEILTTEKQIKEDFKNLKFLDEKKLKTNDNRNITNNNSNSNNKKEKNKIKDASLKFPKNLNEYRHIINTFHVLDSELEWAFDLRTYKEKINYKGLKYMNINPPYFYESDLAAYKTKNDKHMNFKLSNYLEPKGDLTSLNHLSNKRIGGTADNVQFCFETTLRSFKPFQTVKGPIEKWRPISNRSKYSTFAEYLPPMRPDSVLNLKKMEDITTRPYTTNYKVIFKINFFIFIFILECPSCKRCY